MPKPKTARYSPPSRTGKAVSMYLDPDVGEALDSYLAAKASEVATGELIAKPSMKSVIDHALRGFLREEGYYPPPGGK